MIVEKGYNFFYYYILNHPSHNPLFLCSLTCRMTIKTVTAFISEQKYYFFFRNSLCRCHAMSFVGEEDSASGIDHSHFSCKLLTACRQQLAASRNHFRLAAACDVSRKVKDSCHVEALLPLP